MKRRKKKKKYFRHATKVHALVLSAFVVVYFSLGLLFDQSLLFSDMQKKYRFAAHVVSATVRVWGPPNMPVVTATPVCSGGNLHVLVDWDSDENAVSYDIFRDGEELITGLSSSSYQDHNVEQATDYAYYVIAHGPEGDEASAEAGVATGSCSISLPDLEILVTRFENFDMTGYSNIPRTTDRKPEFYGTSGVANGIVRVEMFGSPIILATTLANSNGYWSWTPASNLSYGLNTTYFTVIDPLDSERTDSVAFRFRIYQEEAEDEEDDSSAESGSSSQQPGDMGQTEMEQTNEAGQVEEQTQEGRQDLIEGAPIDVSLRISQIEPVVVQGTDLNTQVYPGYAMTFEVMVASFKGVKSGQKPIFVYSILDSAGEEVYRMAEEKEVSEGDVFSKKITLPNDLEPGKYKLRIEAIVGEYSISEERYFFVQESPVIRFKSGIVSAFSTFFSNLGWLIIISLLILLILIILAIVEYKIHHRDDPGMSGGLKNKGAH